MKRTGKKANGKKTAQSKTAGNGGSRSNRSSSKRTPKAASRTGSGNSRSGVGQRKQAAKKRSASRSEPSKDAAGRTSRKKRPNAAKPHDPNAPVRLQKFLAGCGLGSRRACEEFIKEGRVTINGEVAELGATVNPKSQQVHLDGEHLRPEPRRYYLLNKPRGVLCTNHDPAGRTRVIDLFPTDSPRLFPVGRLDEDSEGLLIVTNDGDFSHMLAHPRHRIYRTYKVQVVGDPPRETLEQLKKGFFLLRGEIQSSRRQTRSKTGPKHVPRSDTHRRPKSRNPPFDGPNRSQSPHSSTGGIWADRIGASESRQVPHASRRRNREAGKHRRPQHGREDLGQIGCPVQSEARHRSRSAIVEVSLRKSEEPRLASGPSRTIDRCTC